MLPEWFFQDFGQWDWWDRELLPLAEQGPVLDLGAGAGRASLYLQERGLRMNAVDASPGAVEVCRRRGVTDVRLGDVNDPPADLPWAGVLLLCGNLGLGGFWEGSRRLLARLARLVIPGGVLVGDSVTPDGPARVVLRTATGTWSHPGGRSTTFRPGRWRPWWMAPAGGWRGTWRTARTTPSSCAGPSPAAPAAGCRRGRRVALGG